MQKLRMYEETDEKSTVKTNNGRAKKSKSLNQKRLYSIYGIHSARRCFFLHTQRGALNEKVNK